MTAPVNHIEREQVLRHICIGQDNEAISHIEDAYLLFDYVLFNTTTEQREMNNGELIEHTLLEFTDLNNPSNEALTLLVNEVNRINQDNQINQDNLGYNIINY